ncbi:MAG: Na/Pi cotransporter family protein [Planctomycetota bacterium]|nr:MAG: Na/Pi cotransporter family protein [Planctomycetota bacterium]
MSYESSPIRDPASSGRASLYLVWLGVFAGLYGLLLAVGLVGNGFKLASGGDETARQLFAFATNPIAGLLVGIMATALVQSSSTVTAIIVGLVAYGTLDVQMAVPMILGANLGTTVTNTIICMAYLNRKTEFRRAFAAATVHDAFNLLAIAIFLPLELLTGFMRHSAGWTAELLGGASGGKFPNPISMATKPVERLFYGGEGSGLLGGLPNLWAGIILAVLGLVLIIGSITVIGKLLKRVLQGRAERLFHAAVGRGPVAGIISGTVVTVMVQSSTTTTSLIVPMAGAGVIKLEKVFPFTVGANIGTCVTALLASMAGGSNPALSQAALQIALVHLYFNLTATLVIMGIPWLRRIPLWTAGMLADLGVRSRSLAIVYVLGLYFGLPILVLFLSHLMGAETLEVETPGPAAIELIESEVSPVPPAHPAPDPAASEE